MDHYIRSVKSEDSLRLHESIAYSNNMESVIFVRVTHRQCPSNPGLAIRTLGFLRIR